MNKPAIPRSRSSLRERHRADTVKLILEAVGRSLEDSSRSDLSLALVAREAGVGERTLYRYFPTKDSLLEAFWRARHASITGPDPTDDRSLTETALRIFPSYDASAELTSRLVTTPQGRSIMQSGNRHRVAVFTQAVREAVGELPEPEFIRLCACVQALLSIGTWLQMREFWGLQGKESGKAVADAIGMLLAAGRRKATKYRKDGQLSD